ncbi:MAG TPA: hypothetical protein VMI75_30990 [Polyangiaceae bacterium]|nr:hypothetical protein [Polyangiaceae bacterium]
MEELGDAFEALNPGRWYAPALSSVEAVTEFGTRLDTVLSLLIEGVAAMRYVVDREAGPSRSSRATRKDLAACLLDWTNDGDRDRSGQRTEGLGEPSQGALERIQAPAHRGSAGARASPRPGVRAGRSRARG